MSDELPDDAVADLRAAAEVRLATFANADGSIPLGQRVAYAVGER